MTDKLRAAAQEALEWLRDERLDTWTYMDRQFYKDCAKHTKALEAALAEPTVKESLTTAEPEEKLLSIHLLDQWLKASLAEQKPMLEMNPQKREFVGLTGPEVDAAYKSVSDKEWAIGGLTDARVFFCAIEAKLREKNT